MHSLKLNVVIITAAICILAGLLIPSLTGLAFALSTNSVTASVTVPNNCITALSNTAIAFGTIIPPGNAPTTNLVTDTNDGNIEANILLDGTNWVYLGNSFFAGNTFWDFSSHSAGVSYTYNTLGLATGNLINTFNQIANSASVNLYFGVSVNNGITQSAGAYTQTITIENGC